MYKVSCAELRLCSALSVSLRSSGLIDGFSYLRRFERDSGEKKKGIGNEVTVKAVSYLSCPAPSVRLFPQCKTNRSSTKEKACKPEK
jgi:hypothetical protein